MRGLYIHIPFCKKKCPYCDFYSISSDKDLASQYLDILSYKIKKINKNISTVYIGGGTPTVLDEELLNFLLIKMEEILKKSEENTIEANPESLTREKIKIFLRRGITRISIGVQSLREEKLKFLGRIHTKEEGVEKVLMAKRLGFKNINIDLIYGLPYEKLSDFKKEIEEAVKLPITHISCYMLTLKKSSPLYKYIKNISQEEVARMYKFLMRYLPSCGFYQYEVSNFAKKNYSSRHNAIYWKNKEYIGLGASSVSYIEGKRVKKIADVKRYIQLVKENISPVIFEEKLSPYKRAKETASLNIRLKEGINFSQFKKETGFDFWQIEDEEEIYNLVKKGLLKYKKRNKKIIGISLTKQGFLFADEVSSSLV